RRVAGQPTLRTGASPPHFNSGRTTRNRRPSATTPARQNDLPILVQSSRIISMLGIPRRMVYDAADYEPREAPGQMRNDPDPSPRPPSAGHSNHELPAFLRLLRIARVTAAA